MNSCHRNSGPSALKRPAPSAFDICSWLLLPIQTPVVRLPGHVAEARDVAEVVRRAGLEAGRTPLAVDGVQLRALPHSRFWAGSVLPSRM